MARLTRQQREIDRILRRLEPAVRNAFIAAIQSAAGQVNITELARLIDQGNITAAVRLLDLPQGSLFPLQEAVRSAYMTGATGAASLAPVAVFAFDGANPRATAWLQAHSSTLIQGIRENTLEAVRNALDAGVSEGRAGRSIALDITGRRVGNRREGGILGLNAQQADSIISARAKLQSGDPALMREYLDLKLRDRRFDGAVKSAIAQGVPIRGAQLDTILNAHKAKALGYRGRVIAKNETFTALSAGRDEAMKQLLDRPEIERIDVRWQHNLSENARADHQAMDGTVIQLGETFNVDGVAMEYPHDPAGGAENNIGCRCIAVYRPVVDVRNG